MRTAPTAIIAFALMFIMIFPASLTVAEEEVPEPTFELLKVSEKAEDLDEDGLFEHLRVTVKVNVTHEGKYRFSADLYRLVREEDRHGVVYLGFDTNVTFLEPGVTKVLLYIDGPLIDREGIDGPYNLDVAVWRVETGEFLDTTVRTGPYSHDDFLPYEDPVGFTGEYNEFTEDEDGDEKHDFLGFEAGVVVSLEGVYLVGGYISGTVVKERREVNEAGETVVVESTHEVDVSFVEYEEPLFFDTHTVEFIFDGMDIHGSGVDGPYNVSLWMSAEPMYPLDEWWEEEWEEDEWGEGEDKDPNDYPDNDGEEKDPGAYPDREGDVRRGAEEEPEREDGEGENYDEVEDPVDPDRFNDEMMPLVHLEIVSEEYKAEDFQVPRDAAVFTGDHKHYGTDKDGDGTFEYLTVSADVDVIEPGEYVVGASLFKTESFGDPEDPASSVPVRTIHHRIGHHVEKMFLEEGVYPVKLNIPGGAIRLSGLDSPYALGLWIGEVPWFWEEEGWWYGDEPEMQEEWNEQEEREKPEMQALRTDLLEPRWPSAEGRMPFDLVVRVLGYTHDMFESPKLPAVFTGEHSDRGVDRDGDGLFEYLSVQVVLDVEVPGLYAVNGELYAGDDWFLTSVDWEGVIGAGRSRVDVDFGADAIMRAKADGPYTAVLSVTPVEIMEREEFPDPAREEFTDPAREEFTDPAREEDTDPAIEEDADPAREEDTDPAREEEPDRPASTRAEDEGLVEDDKTEDDGVVKEDGDVKDPEDKKDYEENKDGDVRKGDDVLKFKTAYYSWDDFESPAGEPVPGADETPNWVYSDDEGVDAHMDVVDARFSKDSPEVIFHYVSDEGEEGTFRLTFLELVAFTDADGDGFMDPGEGSFFASLVRTSWRFGEPAIKENDEIGRYVTFSMTASLDMVGAAGDDDRTGNMEYPDWGTMTVTYTAPEDDVEFSEANAVDITGGSEVKIDILIEVNKPLRADGIALVGMLTDDTGNHEVDGIGGELRPDGAGTRVDDGDTDRDILGPEEGRFEPEGSGDRGMALTADSGEVHGFFTWPDTVSLLMEDGTTRSAEVKVGYTRGPGGLSFTMAYPYSPGVEKVEHSTSVGVVEENAPDRSGTKTPLEQLMTLNPWLYVLTVAVVIIILAMAARAQGREDEEEGDGDWEHGPVRRAPGRTVASSVTIKGMDRRRGPGRGPSGLKPKGGQDRAKKLKKEDRKSLTAGRGRGPGSRGFIRESSGGEWKDTESRGKRDAPDTDDGDDDDGEEEWWDWGEDELERARTEKAERKQKLD